MADRPLSIDIRRPLLLKASDPALLTAEDGNFPLGIPGFGLFYRDTCYLGAYALRLHGTDPLLLMASDAEGMAAQIELTNSKLRPANGQPIPDHKLSLRRNLLMLDDGPQFVDTISLRTSDSRSRLNRFERRQCLRTIPFSAWRRTRRICKRAGRHRMTRLRVHGHPSRTTLALSVFEVLTSFDSGDTVSAAEVERTVGR